MDLLLVSPYRSVISYMHVFLKYWRETIEAAAWSREVFGALACCQAEEDKIKDLPRKRIQNLEAQHHRVAVDFVSVSFLHIIVYSRMLWQQYFAIGALSVSPAYSAPQLKNAAGKIVLSSQALTCSDGVCCDQFGGCVLQEGKCIPLVDASPHQIIPHDTVIPRYTCPL